MCLYPEAVLGCSQHARAAGRRGNTAANLLLPESLRIDRIGISGILCTQLFENLVEIKRKCCINNVLNDKAVVMS